MEIKGKREVHMKTKGKKAIALSKPLVKRMDRLIQGTGFHRSDFAEFVLNEVVRENEGHKVKRGGMHGN